MGFTPISLYSRIVSLERRWGSPLNRSWIAFIRGWRAVIFWVWRSCRIVSGYVRTRVMMVKAMMASPKLLNSHVYSSSNPLVMGLAMSVFQM